MDQKADRQNKSARTQAGPLRILGRANSFNVRKVLWICDEIGILVKADAHVCPLCIQQATK
jgi:hypothetical protein